VRSIASNDFSISQRTEASTTIARLFENRLFETLGKHSASFFVFFRLFWHPYSQTSGDKPFFAEPRAHIVSRVIWRLEVFRGWKGDASLLESWRTKKQR